jgi:hypothetical protein
VIDIESLTLKQIKEIKNLSENKNNHPYIIGQNYFIRTITYFLVGNLVSVYEYELVIKDAAWIPETGRYSDSFKKGEFEEVEPLDGNIIIGRQSIIDCAQWTKELPRKQK